MSRRTLAVAVAVILCGVCGVVATARAQGLVDNPQYTSWAKHKPGTSVVMKMTQNVGGMNQNVEVKQTLKEVTPDQATVEMQMSVGGQSMPGAPVTIKSKVSPEEAKFGQLPAGAKADVKDVGTESVTVGGKTYNCKVAEVTGESQGTKSKGKVWRSDEVPGEIVKMEMNTEGAQAGSVTMELVSVDKK